MKIICKKCKKEKEPSEFYKRKYACKICVRTAWKKFYRTHKSKRKCECCGKEFLAPYGRKTRFCSGTCQNTGHFNPIWRGGRKKVGKYIYILKKDHPNTIAHGYVAEHRLVMEKKLGRYLTENEHVHHKNGIKNDNRSSNLEVIFSLNKKGFHIGTLQCPHCNKKFKVK